MFNHKENLHSISQAELGSHERSQAGAWERAKRNGEKVE
jgi:hypothetical protein